MHEAARFYYYFVFGALGGATGWFVGGLLAPTAGGLPSSAAATATAGTVYHQALFGCALGACIGLAVAAYDGLAGHSWRRFIKFGRTGLLLGALAGSVALPLSQSLYAYLLREGRAGAAWGAAAFILCWTLFGGIIGFIDGIHKGTQSFKGFLGGLTGGLAGGTFYYAALATFSAGTDDATKQLSLAVSLSLLGGAIGAAVVFVTVKLRRAFIEIVNGKRLGEEVDVTKHVSRTKGHRTKPGLIGSDDWSASIYLPGDPGVMPRHAQISFSNGAPTLSVEPEALNSATTLINGEPVSVRALDDGDRIQVGSTTLIYHERGK